MDEGQAGDGASGTLLGRATPAPAHYSPAILYPIPRADSRATLGLASGAPLPFCGVDLWHAYELSWLDEGERPVAAVGRLLVPADSPNMVESKSLKLYFNSLNNTVFGRPQALVDTVQADLARVAGAAVTLDILAPDAIELAGVALPGESLDAHEVSVPVGGPGDNLPEIAQGSTGAAQGEYRLYSHRLRSLCPVTAQPDWASVWLHYRGRPLSQAGLMRYLLAFRNHQEFHEQCVERIFCDIMRCAEPEQLTIQAFYTRRGGLDINPLRSTERNARPLGRLNRQ
ncbi:MAG: NADPH-dependent 7-cyano-7-deazaguanine reductase QueF [Halioglobus sp.]|nr:NADPH-dependent 7-cyano-7-deazaguanine reductase QueF [Halioglobus sp.]